jgi:hypothetical protein
MVEELLIFYHRVGVKNSIDRSINFILQCKDIPADLAMGVLEHSGIETTKDIWWVILSIGGADGCFEGCCEVMAI